MAILLAIPPSLTMHGSPVATAIGINSLAPAVRSAAIVPHHPRLQQLLQPAAAGGSMAADGQKTTRGPGDTAARLDARRSLSTSGNWAVGTADRRIGPCRENLARKRLTVPLPLFPRYPSPTARPSRPHLRLPFPFPAARCPPLFVPRLRRRCRPSLPGSSVPSPGSSVPSPGSSVPSPVSPIPSPPADQSQLSPATALWSLTGAKPHRQ